MLEKGHILVYGNTGVCRIDDICVKDCGAGKKEYYVLAPIYDPRSTLYIPVDSPAFSSNARELLSKEEVVAIIDSLPEAETSWIQNDKERVEIFKNLLNGGERKDIAILIRNLYAHKTELALRGKKLRSSDETIMQRAERLLFGEFSYVLGIEQKDVVAFIKERIG